MVCVVGGVPRNINHLINKVNKGESFFHYGDLCDYISFQNVIEQVRPDYVFHLAAQSYPKTSFTSPINTYDTNIQGTENLLEALRKFSDIDPWIHVCSSSEIFEELKKKNCQLMKIVHSIQHLHMQYQK